MKKKNEGRGDQQNTNALGKHSKFPFLRILENKTIQLLKLAFVSPIFIRFIIMLYSMLSASLISPFFM